MLDTEQLERLASRGEEIPDDLDTPEQLLYLTLRELYKNFHSGTVNRDRAKREKNRIYVGYQKIKAEHDVLEQHLAIRKRLTNTVGEIYKCGCESCRKLINVFNGIDRKDIPEDVKELNAWNERLRDLVKERSDRNAELATVIDRVRWTLESDRTDAEKLERIKEIVSE